MYFTKLFFFVLIAITLCLNFSEAGQQAGKMGKEALKAAGKAAQTGAKNAGKITAVGVAVNTTANVNVKNGSRPSSPSGSKSKSG